LQKMSERQLVRVRKSLRDKGLIDCQHGKGNYRSEYFINIRGLRDVLARMYEGVEDARLAKPYIMGMLDQLAEESECKRLQSVVLTEEGMELEDSLKKQAEEQPKITKAVHDNRKKKALTDNGVFIYIRDICYELEVPFKTTHTQKEKRQARMWLKECEAAAVDPRQRIRSVCDNWSLMRSLLKNEHGYPLQLGNRMSFQQYYKFRGYVDGWLAGRADDGRETEEVEYIDVDKYLKEGVKDATEEAIYNKVASCLGEQFRQLLELEADELLLMVKKDSESKGRAAEV